MTHTPFPLPRRLRISQLRQQHERFKRAPLRSDERAAAINEFLATHNVTRCPTVAVAPTQAEYEVDASLIARNDAQRAKWRRGLLDTVL